MTCAEAIAAVRRGERVTNEHSLHATAKVGEEMLTLCPGFNHSYRVLFCDRGDEDVAECYRCGYQAVVLCNFDDDYA